MRGDIDLMGRPNFDRLYHKLKVLLLLSCNYTMQFVSYDSINLKNFCHDQERWGGGGTIFRFYGGTQLL